MRNATIVIAGAAVMAAALAACQTASAATDGEVLDVRDAMVEGVNPAALAIWDVGNSAIDDEGLALDPAKMDETTWGNLHEAAQSLAAYARRMAEAEAIRASGPDLVGGEVPEGVASREQIQALIDANPEGFRALAAEMGRQAQAIAAAAEARDIGKTGELLLTFDGACETCHEAYWYPRQ